MNVFGGERVPYLNKWIKYCETVIKFGGARVPYLMRPSLTSRESSVVASPNSFMWSMQMNPDTVRRRMRIMFHCV